jgi:hypothetical protein
VSIYKKRRPYPFDVIIGGTGFLIGSQQPGQPALVSVETQGIQQVAPPDYSYAGDNPTNDREEPFQQLTLGLGLPGPGDSREVGRPAVYRGERGRLLGLAVDARPRDQYLSTGHG